MGWAAVWEAMQEGRSSDLCWIRCGEGFLSAWKDGSMRVLPHVRSWEWFTITVVAERKVTLLTHHGSYVVAGADGVLEVQTVASVLRSTAGSLRSTPARLTSEQRTDRWVQDHGSSRQPPGGLGGSE